MHLAGKAKHRRGPIYHCRIRSTGNSILRSVYQYNVWFTCLFTLNIGDCSFERGLCNWKNWKNKEEDQFDWMIGKAVAKSQSQNQHPSNLINGENPNDECLLLVSVQTDRLADLPAG